MFKVRIPIRFTLCINLQLKQCRDHEHVSSANLYSATDDYSTTRGIQVRAGKLHEGPLQFDPAEHLPWFYFVLFRPCFAFARLRHKLYPRVQVRVYSTWAPSPTHMQTLPRVSISCLSISIVVVIRKRHMMTARVPARQTSRQ